MTLRRFAPVALPTMALLAACSATENAPADRTDLLASREPSTVVQHVATRTPDILGGFGSVTVYKSGYGSGMAAVPGASRTFLLLTDRGPNIDGPGGSKIFPVPTYAPRIYRAQMAGSKLLIQDEIVLKRPDGSPLTGLPIPVGQCGSTGEAAFAVDGSSIAPDPLGLDSEGLVALADGTFWISDEYGPFLAHYAADGRELERLGPCDGGLPEVYKLRRPNRGMEGLTITPDGQWLVGIMQAPLENPAPAGVRNVSRATRVLFRHLTTGATKEYVYLLERANLQGNSEIVALSDTRFLVLERDGDFLEGSPAATFKRIYEMDISGATEISALGALGARPIGGTKTIEQASVQELALAGIAPAAKSLYQDLLTVGYPHDKPEGMVLAPGGMLFVVNDDDFGIVGNNFSLVQKLLPPTTSPDVVTLWQLRVR